MHIHQVAVKTIKMAGIARISALAIHKDDLASPRTLIISALTAEIIHSTPALMATRAAIIPRL